jgi:multidrug efflux pump subunit AcrB
MRMKMKQGVSALQAAREVVGQTGVPLLGATFIAIAAFASIGTSQDSTGEYCRSLFTVIFISLTLSWVTAVTSTPLFCATFLKPAGSKNGKEGEEKDPYGGKFYQLYKGLLTACLQRQWISVAVVVVLFVLSLVGFGHVKKSFFPDSTRPQFYVDFWFPEGTHIDETERQVARAEKILLDNESFEHVTSQIGGGSPRILLTYSPEYNYRSFARILVDVSDYKTIAPAVPVLQRQLEEKFPQATIHVRMFVNGPSTGGKIQLRIYGPDAEKVRRLGARAEAVFLAEPNARAVRNEWRTKIKAVRPQLAEAQARRAGIDRPQLANAIAAEFDGLTVGVYREDDELLPIIARSPDFDRMDLDSVNAMQVWSPAAQNMIPVGQIVTGFATGFEDPHIWRRNRTKMLKFHLDPLHGLAGELFAVVKPKIEKALNVDVAQITGKRTAKGQDPFARHTAATLTVREADMWPLKDMPGYFMAWGGEAEDTAKGQDGIAGYIPIFFGLMILLVIVLFNSIKKTLVIWLTVPLAIIGVTFGLLLFRQPFGFMSLLGLMSLAGMLIKNAIVLIDQIDIEIASGKPGFQAIVDSGVSRLIPVSMAALTTILGMLPLLQDAFFIAMAVTIMFGLGFATVLTLIVVPVLYALFFKVKATA